MGIREHFCPKHLLSKTCKRKVNTDWLFWLPPPTLIAWPEWLRFWVSDVCCQMQRYWRLSQKRLNVHVNKDSSNSLYAEDILLFLKLELIRSIFTGVKKEGTIKRKCSNHYLFRSLFFFSFFTVIKLTFQSHFWFSLYPTKRHLLIKHKHKHKPLYS